MWNLLITAFAASAAAIPTAHPRVVHEKRSTLTSSQYVRSSRLAADAVVPVRIALKQSNLDRGYAHLMDVSHPSSDTYGSHWTAEEVAAEFQPAEDTVDSVLQWLQQHGIEDARQTSNRGWIAFDASATQIEHLFDTQLHEYRHDQDGTTRVGCDKYSLPSHVSPHVDYITPGIQLSPPMTKSTLKRGLSRRTSAGRMGWHHRPGRQHPHHPVPYHPPQYDNSSAPPGYGDIPLELQQCGRNITPPCLQALYDIPSAQADLDDGILGIYENGDEYSQQNLNQYFSTYAPYVPNGTHPALVSINGGTAPAPVNSTDNGGESDVDFDIAFSSLGDVPITLYQVNSPYQDLSIGSTLMDPFFAAVDSAYCDDDEKEDGFQCASLPLSSVISISYGVPENTDSYNAQQRACNEFMKLSLQGHTFVVSSGDYGVAANPLLGPSARHVCDRDGCLARTSGSNLTHNATGQVFNPNFPASCPYVLSVGATQLEDDSTVNDPETVMFLPDAGILQQAECSNAKAFFTSGGGFSNYFSQPSYQSSAVSDYFNSHDPGYPSYTLTEAQASDLTSFPGNGIYNRAGRAFPDVSANGAKFNIFLQDLETQEAGTSLSAPIWASILAMINQKRKDAGKGPVGFVNTVLYENPSVFHDITNGTNPGCGTDGFAAVEGWDPVTGLGTPDYSALEALFLNLP